MEQPSWQRFLYLGFPENYHLAMENHHFCDRRYIVQNGWFSTVMLVFQGLLIYLMRYLTHHLLEMSWACFWNYKWSVTSISIFCSNLLYNVHRKSHDLNSPFHFPSSTSRLSEFPRELSAKVTMVGFPACPAHNIDALVFRWGDGPRPRPHPWGWPSRVAKSLRFPQRNQSADLHQQHSLQWPGSDTWRYHVSYEWSLIYEWKILPCN